jgi:hypothetical protein
MKNKKNISFKLTIIILVFVTLGAHHTLATKRAIFPDAKLLQPMPNPDVHPNISGNINSTTISIPNNEPKQDLSTTQKNPDTTQPIEVKNGSNWIFYLIGLIIILLIIILYRKFRRK